MAFQQGLSGLNTASRNLDVIGHNIANANTVGMKTSRAEFADLYSSSINAAGGVGGGIGVTLATVSQTFSQGNITVTGNTLDVAINGNGFFELTMPNNTLAYSRDGQFKLDLDGHIVTNQGGKLMGYMPGTSSAQPEILKLPEGSKIGGSPTGLISASLNLDARAEAPTPPGMFGTSVLAYDAQGLEIPVNLSFEKTDRNSWNVFTTVNGVRLPDSFELRFGDDGTRIGNEVFKIDLRSPDNPDGPTFEANLRLNATQFGTPFAVSTVQQDGRRPGELAGLKIEDDGVITARYTNGLTQSVGQIALAIFRNTQGLTPLGGNTWGATTASGERAAGRPGGGLYGSLRGNALEDSNVDLTSELVNMMSAQRAYQANAQTIKTQDQVLSTLLNMR